MTEATAKFNAIVYDLETLAAFPPSKGKQKEEGIIYCEGWQDFENMGISVLTAYSWRFDYYRVFEANELRDFETLAADHKDVIGFNSSKFDDVLLEANGIKVVTTYDLLCEFRIASGFAPYWTEAEKNNGISFSLDLMSKLNLGYGKIGSGSNAPIQWQRNRKAEVKAYCLHDVRLTQQLFELSQSERLLNPNDGSWLHMARLGGEA